VTVDGYRLASEESAASLLMAAYHDPARLSAAIDDVLDAGHAGEVLAVLAESLAGFVAKLEEGRLSREAADIVGGGR
jgi:hypothetical protein